MARDKIGRGGRFVTFIEGGTNYQAPMPGWELVGFVRRGGALCAVIRYVTDRLRGKTSRWSLDLLKTRIQTLAADGNETEAENLLLAEFSRRQREFNAGKVFPERLPEEGA